MTAISNSVAKLNSAYIHLNAMTKIIATTVNFRSSNMKTVIHETTTVNRRATKLTFKIVFLSE